MIERRTNTDQQDQNESNRQQTEQHKLAENPNPRANENIKHSDLRQDDENSNDEVGSEITDGEDA